MALPRPRNVDPRVRAIQQLQAQTLGAGGPTAAYFLTPEQFGAVGGGTTDDSAAILAAISAAESGSFGVVKFRPFTAYRCDASLTVDAAKVALHGLGTTLLWTTAPASGFGIKVTSSATFSTRYTQWHPVIQGISLRGNTSSPIASTSGLVIGDAGATEVDNFTIAYGGVEGFADGVTFASNAWRVTFDHFNVRENTVTINVPNSGLTNFGECMMWRDSMFEGPVNMGSGEWHFPGCSFDNAPIVVNGDCSVYLPNVHLENPGATSSYRYIDISYVDGAVFLSDAEVVVNALAGGGNVNLCLFHVDDTVTARGLVMTNVKFPQTGHYAPESGSDVIRALVAGAGRVVCGGVSMNNNGFQFPISRSLNVIYNGDAEIGTKAGWSQGGSGSTANITVDSTTHHTGSKSFKLTPGGGTNLFMFQNVACKPGQYLMGQIWSNVTVPASNNGNFDVEVFFLAADASAISTVGHVSYTSSTAGWQVNWFDAVAPPGTVQAQLFVICNAGTTGGAFTSGYIDDVLITVT